LRVEVTVEDLETRGVPIGGPDTQRLNRLSTPIPIAPCRLRDRIGKALADFGTFEVVESHGSGSVGALRSPAQDLVAIVAWLRTEPLLVSLDSGPVTG
jgi:hypothetical protein